MPLSDEELAAVFLSPSRLRTLTDEDLMAALRMGCNDALAVLFERHSALVFRIARAILHDDGEAEEAVQRVFLDVFKAANLFNPDRGSFKTWLLQYAYHRSTDRRQHLQSNRFYSRDELDELMPAELFNGPGHLLCLPPQEVVYLVEQVLATLESRQRRVIELTGLVVSVGVAPTKMAAKILSDMSKPDGLLLIGPEYLQGFLEPLPVERLWGVG